MKKNNYRQKNKHKKNVLDGAAECKKIVENKSINLKITKRIIVLSKLGAKQKTFFMINNC